MGCTHRGDTTHRKAREGGRMAAGPQSYLAVITFEGRQRALKAEQGIMNLKGKVDTLIVIPNDRLLDVGDPDTSVLEAFRMADEVLLQGVQGITELITTPGLINLDFADVKTVMTEAGSSLMG